MNAQVILHGCNDSSSVILNFATNFYVNLHKKHLEILSKINSAMYSLILRLSLFPRVVLKSKYGFKWLCIFIFFTNPRPPIFLIIWGSQSSLWNALSKTNFLSSQRNINKAFYTKYICSRSQSVDSFKSFLFIFFISFPAKKTLLRRHKHCL